MRSWPATPTAGRYSGAMDASTPTPAGESATGHPPLHPPGPGQPKNRALRVIAAFEAVKALLALAAALGLLGLLHRDLHQLATTLISHVGLDPGGRYPTLLLQLVDIVQDANLRMLLLGAGAYVVVRLLEAWGLWRGRSWGEWLGALSGALYVPFEVRHLLHKPGWGGLAVLLLNIGVVAFLAWQLWRERRAGTAA